jgi:uncharacterized OB-fold protein
MTGGDVAAPFGPTGDDQPFWDGAAEGRLTFQRCDDCGFVRWPAAGVCPECLSRSGTWTEVVGEGTIWSHVVYHRAYAASLRADVPYAVGLVQLDCGVRLVTRLVDFDDGAPAVGQAVSVRYQALGEHGTVAVFGPSR